MTRPQFIRLQEDELQHLSYSRLRGLQYHQENQASNLLKNSAELIQNNERLYEELRNRYRVVESSNVIVRFFTRLFNLNYKRDAYVLAAEEARRNVIPSERCAPLWAVTEIEETIQKYTPTKAVSTSASSYTEIHSSVGKSTDSNTESAVRSQHNVSSLTSKTGSPVPHRPEGSNSITRGIVVSQHISTESPARVLDMNTPPRTTQGDDSKNQREASRSRTVALLPETVTITQEMQQSLLLLGINSNDGDTLSWPDMSKSYLRARASAHPDRNNGKREAYDLVESAHTFIQNFFKNVNDLDSQHTGEEFWRTTLREEQQLGDTLDDETRKLEEDIAALEAALNAERLAPTLADNGGEHTTFSNNSFRV